MPDYEIGERHHIQIAAPPHLTFAAACEADLIQSPVIRAIFKRARTRFVEPATGAVSHKSSGDILSTNPRPAITPRSRERSSLADARAPSDSWHVSLRLQP